MVQDCPFNDEFEFDLSLRLLGKTVKRRAKVAFEYRPYWKFWDIKTARELEGSLFLSMEFLIRSEPDNAEPPEWFRLDLIEEGVLPSRVWDKIDSEIDLKCKAIDMKRRKHAGDARAVAQTSKKLN